MQRLKNKILSGYYYLMYRICKFLKLEGLENHYSELGYAIDSYIYWDMQARLEFREQ